MSDRAAVVAALGILGVFVAAVGVGVSHGPKDDFTTLCQNADYVRLDDSSCDRGDRGSTVMYISTNSNYHVPAVGGKIEQSRVVNVVPRNMTIQKNAITPQGGVVKNNPNIVRGIFGGAFKGSAGS